MLSKNISEAVSALFRKGTNEVGRLKDSFRIMLLKALSDHGVEIARWKIERFASEDDAKNGVQYSEEDAMKLFGAPQYTVINQELAPGLGNMLVNAGINALWTLVCGTGATKFDNTNAYLGVGDSSTAEGASQTDLQAASNKLRKAMNGGYPTYGTSQKGTWQSDFTSAEANFAWNEFGVFNAAAAGTMLNRKVSSQGTKTAGQTWRLTLEITLA